MYSFGNILVSLHTRFGIYWFETYLFGYIPIWEHTRLGTYSFGNKLVWEHVGTYPFGYILVWEHTRLGTNSFGNLGTYSFGYIILVWVHTRTEDHLRHLAPSASSLPAAVVGETVPHHQVTYQPLQGQLFPASNEGGENW